MSSERSHRPTPRTGRPTRRTGATPATPDAPATRQAPATRGAATTGGAASTARSSQGTRAGDAPARPAGTTRTTVSRPSGSRPAGSRPSGSQPATARRAASRPAAAAPATASTPRPAATPTARPAGAGATLRGDTTPSGGLARANLRLVVGALAAVALVVGGYLVWDALRPITVWADGIEVEVSTRTVEAVYEAAGEPASYGDLYDVEGVLIEEGAGDEPVVTVNGEAAGFQTELHEGDEVTFADGADAEEPSEVVSEEEIAYDVVEEGAGPIYSITQEGETGTLTTKTGTISGKTVTVTTKEPVDQVYERWYADVGDDKVIALTFDDGPTAAYTSEILDILAEYGVVATFFTIGEQVATDWGAELVQREVEEGHQVCTHTWDHASGSGNGVNLSYMTADEQRAEVEDGYQAIADALGCDVSSVSTVIRAPGGNYPLEVWQNLEDLVSAQVTWTIDTRDWSRPGTSSIVASIESAGSGDIVLMHDGGGDRSQTVEALREAIPYLLEQGYTFVTIDELMAYGRAE